MLIGGVLVGALAVIVVVVVAVEFIGMGAEEVESELDDDVKGETNGSIM